MVSENIKNHSVTFLMPEITVNDTLFDFLSHLYQEMPLLWFSIWLRWPFWTAILNLKVKANPKYNQYHSIRSVKPKLVENITY